jgi:hypothetical protein
LPRNFDAGSRVYERKQGCGPAITGRAVEGMLATMRYIVLWALGVPISGLIVLHLLGMI